MENEIIKIIFASQLRNPHLIYIDICFENDFKSMIFLNDNKIKQVLYLKTIIKRINFKL